MPPPRYRPTCNYRACRNANGEMATATTYVVDERHEPVYVCGACARKMAIKLGLEPDPKADPKKARPKRKARAVA